MLRIKDHWIDPHWRFSITAFISSDMFSSNKSTLVSALQTLPLERGQYKYFGYKLGRWYSLRSFKYRNVDNRCNGWSHVNNGSIHWVTSKVVWSQYVQRWKSRKLGLRGVFEQAWHLPEKIFLPPISDWFQTKMSTNSKPKFWDSRIPNQYLKIQVLPVKGEPGIFYIKGPATLVDKYKI